MIAVDRAGQNSIAVASGANFRLTKADVEAAWAVLDKVDVLVMPLETPLEAIETAVGLAHHSGARVILNPAPARPVPPHILAGVDVLVPNEPETTQLTGMPTGTKSEIENAARELLRLGVTHVVLTLGSRGALVLEGTTGRFQEIAPFPVNVVDTTAAGDAFVAGMAVGLGEGKSLIEAARFANASGALAVTRPGAQPSLPTRAEVDELLEMGRVQ